MNYQKEYENIINNLNGKKNLLLHSCCAPCSSYVLEYLSKYFKITILYYNPNIPSDWIKTSDTYGEISCDISSFTKFKDFLKAFSASSYFSRLVEFVPRLI